MQKKLKVNMNPLVILFILLNFSLFSQRKNEKSMGVKKYGKSPATSPWIYKKTQPGEIQERELPRLFRWTITPNRREYRKIQEEKQRKRERERVRGNEVFHRRKYNR